MVVNADERGIAQAHPAGRRTQRLKVASDGVRRGDRERHDRQRRTGRRTAVGPDLVIEASDPPQPITLHSADTGTFSVLTMLLASCSLELDTD